VLSALAPVVFGRWLNATKRGGQEPAEPFRIAGNLYFVGANDVAAFLITGPHGHVVLDSGHPRTASMTMASNASADAIRAHHGRPLARLHLAVVPRPRR
jgi:metallo-beta-lactamase class B